MSSSVLNPADELVSVIECRTLEPSSVTRAQADAPEVLAGIEVSVGPLRTTKEAKQKLHGAALPSGAEGGAAADGPAPFFQTGFYGFLLAEPQLASGTTGAGAEPGS